MAERMMANPPAGPPTPGFHDHTVEHEQTVRCRHYPACVPVRSWRDLPWAPIPKPTLQLKAVGAMFNKWAKRQGVWLALSKERDRQDEKWGWPNAGLAGVDLDKKVSILAEEFGEVAHAVLEGDLDNLRDELVQVAAVCVAWLESEEGWS